MEYLKVSASSQPRSLAGAIAAIARENNSAHLIAIGAGAINQTIKAIAIARGYVLPNGIDLVCIPVFTQTEVDGVQKTSMKFIVEAR